MTNVVSLPDEERRYDEASRWIAKLDRELTSVEEGELQHWLADPDNEALLLDMAQLWDHMESLSRLAHLFPSAVRRRSRWPEAMMGMAASLLVAVLAGLWLWQGDRFMGDVAVVAEGGNIYQTAVGERSTVTLVDGTRLTLNTNSRVKVDYSDHSRVLNLVRGEIYVKVAKDKSRPLSVLANDKVVQAVGTEFSVEITDDQKIELMVTEGRVRVAVHTAEDTKQVARAPVDPLPLSALAVSAGEELIFDDTDNNQDLAAKVAQVTPEEIEVKLSWQQGNLIFRGEPLEQAIREVGRYTSVEFVILDEELRQVRVAGLFKAGDVDSLLMALRENFNIVSRRTNDQKILLSSEADAQ